MMRNFGCNPRLGEIDQYILSAMICLLVDHPQVISTPERTEESNQFCIVNARRLTTDSRHKADNSETMMLSPVTALNLLDTNNLMLGWVQ